MIESDFYEKSMERKERFYKLINDFISECEKKGIRTDFIDDPHARVITIGIKKDGAAAALSYPKKIAYFEYDIADIEQGLSDMFQLFAKKYEEKNQ
jgi:hypothetical protein|nr:MAG TPA: hypothetical protein [Caudoviricetes sp.]